MKLLRALLAPAFLFANAAGAQITITAADMPVNGDTLRYSVSNPLTTTVDYLQTGPNMAWDFSNEVAIAQGVDTYKTALQVNIAYTSISPSAYGYKVADSFAGAPVPVNEIYNFFNKKTGPDRFVIEGWGARIAGFPTPVVYSDEDEVYYFPLDYNDYDSSSFKLTLNLAFGSLSQEGYRRTTVDGWGTVMTPYTTSPVQVIRVRSEVVENDTISFGPTQIGIPRHYVEYKWLANGEHYPMMELVTNIVMGNEVPSNVTYRDMKRSVGIRDAKAAVQHIALYPNPAGAEVTLKIPAGWLSYSVEVFDAQGKLVSAQQNKAQIATSALPAGTYFVRVQHGAETGLAQFIR